MVSTMKDQCQDIRMLPSHAELPPGPQRLLTEVSTQVLLLILPFWHRRRSTKVCSKSREAPPNLPKVWFHPILQRVLFPKLSEFSVLRGTSCSIKWWQHNVKSLPRAQSSLHQRWVTRLSHCFLLAFQSSLQKAPHNGSSQSSLLTVILMSHVSSVPWQHFSGYLNLH